MKGYKKLIILLFILMFPTASFASGKAQLNLWKKDPFYYGPCGHCAELVSSVENKDRTDFFPYDNLDLRSGYFVADLIGPAGTSVTLYGSEDFRTNHGYLVIVKKDDSIVEINDLEAFTADEWTDVENEKGAYSVFYHPHENFKSLVASLQWGKGPQSGTAN
mgnify:FL=1|jgi:hypothetical protein